MKHILFNNENLIGDLKGRLKQAEKRL